VEEPANRVADTRVSADFKDAGDSSVDTALYARRATI